MNARTLALSRRRHTPTNKPPRRYILLDQQPGQQCRAQPIEHRFAHHQQR
jgi:hypothetical protein